MSNIIYELKLAFYSLSYGIYWEKNNTKIASLLLSLISSWETYNLEFEVTNKR